MCMSIDTYLRPIQYTIFAIEIARNQANKKTGLRNLLHFTYVSKSSARLDPRSWDANREWDVGIML